MNDTVKCDRGLYKSLQAWKDHKLHIEHEVLLNVASFSNACLILCDSVSLPAAPRSKPCRPKSKTSVRSKVT